MRVFERIHDADIEGNGCSAAVADYFCEKLNEIVSLSIPIRESAEETEELYKRVIWVDWNLHQDNDAIYDYKGVDENGEPQNYKVRRLDYIESLKQALKYDDISFGYLYNLLLYGHRDRPYDSIEEELAEARAHYPAPELIHFFIEYDIDSLREKIREIESPAEKENYIKELIACVQNEKEIAEEYREAVSNSLELMYHEAQVDNRNRMTAYASLYKRMFPSNEDKHGLIFFNFWGDELPALSAAASKAKNPSLDQKRILFQADNSSYFVEKLLPYFEKYRGGVAINRDVTIEVFREFTGRLMFNYLERLSLVVGEDYNELFFSGKKWMNEACLCLDRACRRFSGNKDEKTKEKASTFRMMLYYGINGTFSAYFLAPERNLYPNVLSNVPFNCWGDSFSERVNNAAQKIIHRADDLRFIDFFDNCLYFAGEFEHKYNDALKKLSSTDQKEAREIIEDWICQLAEDYFSRITRVENVSPEGLAFGVSLWLWEASFFTNCKLKTVLDSLNFQAEAFSKGEAMPSKFHNIHCSFRRGLEDDLQAIFKRIEEESNGYIQKVKGGELVAHNPVIADNNTPTKSPQQLAKAHNCTIDYSALYSAWNNEAFTRTSLDDLTNAIDNADFKAMMEVAENTKHTDGYVGALKYIIKCLGESLGSDWYDKACRSIGTTPGKVNKLNQWTARIERIDLSIISTAIS